MSADRNLLFGVLACQMDFITREQLVAALNAWVLDKPRSLSEILVQHGALAEAQRRLLEPLVEQHVMDHGNDPQRSLAAVSSVSGIHEQLQRVADADVQHTLNFLGSEAGRLDGPTRRPEGNVEGARYRVLRPHARGGLGEIFVAKDTELNRDVALKEIRAGRDQVENRARFILEAEITGGLEHPGIVPVYGLGHYSDGRPYYAMRFIKGDNLAEAIKRFHGEPGGLSARNYDSIGFRRLLQRFIDVCNAVAYAHSRGVLHRDLKPGNIMLGKYGETLVVDWGLAKVQTGQEPAGLATGDEDTLRPTSGSGVTPTQQGSALGTPAYMSPEQAAGKLGELGPASDVYSLAATLYHLLVGKPPNADRDVMEILALCQQGKVPPPLSVVPTIPNAINAVCLRAMATHPGDRYRNAEELAAEIERWLADEPVVAWPEPVSARARRWMRKHPGPVAGIAATLIVGIIGALIGAYVLGDKNRQLAKFNSDLQVARADADNKRDTAQANYRLALDAYNDMVHGFQLKLEARAGTLDLRKELLEKARQGLQALLSKAEQAGNADNTLTWTHLRMGDVLQVLGEVGKANQQYQLAHDRITQFLLVDPKNFLALHDLSAALDRLGDIALKQGKAAAALANFRGSQTIREQLAAAKPDNLNAQRELYVSVNKLGDSQLQLGNPKEARSHYLDGLQIVERVCQAHPQNQQLQRDLSIAFHRLGSVNMQLGDGPAAVAYYRRRLGVLEKIAQADPANVQIQSDRSGALINLGTVLHQVGELDESFTNYRSGVEACERMVQMDPKNAMAQQGVATGYYKLGSAFQWEHQYVEARECFEKALARFERLQQDGWIENARQMIGPTWTFQAWLDDTKTRLTFCKNAERAMADLAFAMKQPKDDIPALLRARIRMLAAKDDAPSCIATAEAVTTLDIIDAEGDFDAACIWSVCAAVAKEQAAACADKAMLHLRQSVDAGFDDLQRLKTDKDLATLRPREDFKKLMADVAEKRNAEKQTGKK